MSEYPVCRWVLLLDEAVEKIAHTAGDNRDNGRGLNEFSLRAASRLVFIR